MTRKRTTKKTPEVVEDKELDAASGGISLLVPAVQAAREAVRNSTVDVTSTATLTFRTDDN